MIFVMFFCVFLAECRVFLVMLTKLIASKHYFGKEVFCNHFGRAGIAIPIASTFFRVSQGIAYTPLRGYRTIMLMF